jgi:multiple sugar transport system permease protein/raffinose/stachyose/melibiose transport system permease protein
MAVELRRHWLVYVGGVVVPVLLFALFVGYPIVRSVYLSFTEWNGLSEPRWVGLQNYRDLTGDEVFRNSIANTAKWVVGSVLFASVLGFLAAVLLRSRRLYFGGLFRLVIFLPVTMSLVAVGLMFAFILDPSFGAGDTILRALGFEDVVPDLLGNSDRALWTLIIVSGWTTLGAALIMFDAGLTQVPDELYEAARLDGANGWQVMRFVTLPALAPIFLVVTMLAVFTGLIAFDLILVMTAGGPGSATHTLGFYMYRTAFVETRFGYSAAIATLMLVVSVVFAAVYLRRIGRNILGAER